MVLLVIAVSRRGEGLGSMSIGNAIVSEMARRWEKVIVICMVLLVVAMSTGLFKLIDNAYKKHESACKHEFGMWEMQRGVETSRLTGSSAPCIIQTRQCKKCGWAEMKQVEP